MSVDDAGAILHGSRQHRTWGVYRSFQFETKQLIERSHHSGSVLLFEEVADDDTREDASRPLVDPALPGEESDAKECSHH